MQCVRAHKHLMHGTDYQEHESLLRDYGTRPYLALRLHMAHPQLSTVFKQMFLAEFGQQDPASHRSTGWPYCAYIQD